MKKSKIEGRIVDCLSWLTWGKNFRQGDDKGWPEILGKSGLALVQKPHGSVRLPIAHPWVAHSKSETPWKQQMTSTIIDFSAQFGGRDAAAAALPHFKALKAASRDLRLEGFPFAKLAYILRVDGEVNRYGLSGAGSLETDSNEDYLSIDIGIRQEDRPRIVEVICDAILSSSNLIRDQGSELGWKLDFNALNTCLLDLITRYKKDLSSRSGL